VADNDSIRVLVGEASKMASQLIAITLKRIRNPRFEVILPPYFTSTAIIDEIIKTKPDVALVSNCLQDGTFAGYTVLRNLQIMNLSSRLILLLEESAQMLVIDAFRAGARGIFSRAESTELLSSAFPPYTEGRFGPALANSTTFSKSWQHRAPGEYSMLQARPFFRLGRKI